MSRKEKKQRYQMVTKEQRTRKHASASGEEIVDGGGFRVFAYSFGSPYKAVYSPPLVFCFFSVSSTSSSSYQSFTQLHPEITTFLSPSFLHNEMPLSPLLIVIEQTENDKKEMGTKLHSMEMATTAGAGPLLKPLSKILTRLNAQTSLLFSHSFSSYLLMKNLSMEREKFGEEDNEWEKTDEHTQRLVLANPFLPLTWQKKVQTLSSAGQLPFSADLSLLLLDEETEDQQINLVQSCFPATLKTQKVKSLKSLFPFQLQNSAILPRNPTSPATPTSPSPSDQSHVVVEDKVVSQEAAGGFRTKVEEFVLSLFMSKEDKIIGDEANEKEKADQKKENEITIFVTEIIFVLNGFNKQVEQKVIPVSSFILPSSNSTTSTTQQ